MKLATALSERADLQRRIAELEMRLRSNAKTQEGEEPAEDPQQLLAELDSCINAWESLMARINLTNSRTSEKGITMTEMLAKRDTLSKRLQLMRSFLDSASAKVDRFTRTEIRIVSTVDVAAYQKSVDDCSRDLRELDEKIQSLNWTTELM